MTSPEPKPRVIKRPRSPRTEFRCAGCGASVSRIPSEVRDPERVFCKRLCYQQNGGQAQRWGGRPRTAATLTYDCPDGVTRTRVIDPNGYHHVYWPEHPNANASKRVAVHVIVMTDHLGRPLEPGETVHHDQGNRSDNRIERLELWSSAQPAGQRVEDKVAFGLNMVEAYLEQAPEHWERAESLLPGVLERVQARRAGGRPIGELTEEAVEMLRLYAPERLAE